MLEIKKIGFMNYGQEKRPQVNKRSEMATRTW